MGGNETGTFLERERAGAPEGLKMESTGRKRRLFATDKGSNGTPGECERRTPEEVEADDSWLCIESL